MNHFLRPYREIGMGVALVLGAGMVVLPGNLGAQAVTWPMWIRTRRRR